MHEELGVLKDVRSEPRTRTGSSANAKFATGEAHDGNCVQETDWGVQYKC